MAVLCGASRDVDPRGMERAPILNARARSRSPLQGLALFPLLAGPSLLVMIGGNDAGGVITYSSTGPQYGIAVFVACLLHVAQDTTARPGAVSQKGHAERISDRIGRFRSIFSIVDLVLGNCLTRVTGSASVLEGGASPCR